MSKSDVALLVLNIAVLMMAMVGLASQHPEPMTIARLLAIGSVFASSTKLIRKGSAVDRTIRRRNRQIAPDEMDARTVLDIDARLEALERREREMNEALRIQALAARGQQHAPDEPLADESDVRPRRERA